MALPALVVLTQALGEFYPFSNFPMYSNPSDQPSDYVFVADATVPHDASGFTPVSMEYVFGVRAAKAKKIFNSRLTDYGKERGLRRHELSLQQQAEVADTMLEFLRGRAAATGNSEQVPARLALVRGTVTAELGVALHVDSQMITREP